MGAPRTFADFERLQDGRPRRAAEDLCACDGDEEHASWCPAAAEEARRWALYGEPIGYGHVLQTAAARHKARRGR